MRVRPSPDCFPRPRSAFRSSKGFSLVELMVAVTILSMIFMLAVPTYQRLQRKARTATMVNDFRVFAAAFQAHAHAAGEWPADAGAGVVPTGMTSEEFKADSWTRKTPIGGEYNWERDVLIGGVIYKAAIAVAEDPTKPFDLLQIADIDQSIDDGDLEKGLFLYFGDSPVFIVEK